MKDQKLSESIIFLGCCRVALRDVIDLTEDMEIEARTHLKNFIMNEASDYQIITMVVEGNIPEKKYDDVAESDQFGAFRKIVHTNADLFAEAIGKQETMDLFYEVGPISSCGLTSSVSTLEFLMHQFDMAQIKLGENKIEISKEDAKTITPALVIATAKYAGIKAYRTQESKEEGIKAQIATMQACLEMCHCCLAGADKDGRCNTAINKQVTTLKKQIG